MNKFFDEINYGKYLKLTQCYDQLYGSDFYMDMHKHEGMEIMYVIEGCMTFESEIDGEQSTIDIWPGNFVLIDSGHDHKISIKDKAHIFNMQVRYFDEPQCNRHLNVQALRSVDKNLDKFFSDAKPCYIDFDEFDFASILKKIVFRSREMMVDGYSMINQLLVTMLCEIGYLYVKHYKSYKGNTYVKKAVAIIEKNNMDISGEKIAQMIGISYVYLNKLFQESFQMGIVQYVNARKIDKACIIMQKHLEKSIALVAREVGFNNVRHFERVFKKIKGFTPSQYKENVSLSQDFYLYHWI